MNSKLIVFERVLTHYRLKFYNYLTENYPVDIIFLRGITNNKGFITDINKAKFKIINLRCIKILGFEFYLWPIELINSSNTIACLLSFRSLPNIIYLFLSKLWGCSFFWWGHSKTFNGSGFRYTFQNYVNRIIMKMGDGMLAYTNSEKERIKKYGIADNKIITLNNTLQTEEIIKIVDKIKNSSLDTFKKKNNLYGFKIVGLIGRLYKDRRAEFAIDAVLDISKRINNLKMIIIGGGDDYINLRQKYNDYPNIIFLGPIEEEKELAPWMSSIDIFLNPGIVGLNLVHSFLYSAATVTIKSTKHSPEIEYLRDSINGLITNPDFSSFVNGVEFLISNPKIAKEMGKNGFELVTQKLNIKNMADNFLKIME